MFVAKYHISQKILGAISLSEAARELIQTLTLSNVWENKLRQEARLKQLYHNLHLEGSALGLDQVQDLLDGKEVSALIEDIADYNSLVGALNFLQTIVSKIGVGQGYNLTLETLSELHRLVSTGQFRGKQVVIRDAWTGEITYTPPPAAELPYLLEDLISWINSETGQNTHPLLKAGITHFELQRIHPFSTKNDLTARLLSGLLLNLDGYNLKGFLCLEEYFDGNLLEYHTTSQKVASQQVIDTHERDLTSWLEFYTQGIFTQFDQAKERVVRLSRETRVSDKLGEPLELSERQLIVMEYLHRHKTIKNADFRKIFPDFSDDTVLREIKFLKKKGLIRKEGNTKMARYVLATQGQ